MKTILLFIVVSDMSKRELIDAVCYPSTVLELRHALRFQLTKVRESIKERVDYGKHLEHLKGIIEKRISVCTGRMERHIEEYERSYLQSTSVRKAESGDSRESWEFKHLALADLYRREIQQYNSLMQLLEAKINYEYARTL